PVLELGGDVDFRRLDPPVALGESFRQFLDRVEVSPHEVTKNGNRDQGRAEHPVEYGLPQSVSRLDGRLLRNRGHGARRLAGSRVWRWYALIGWRRLLIGCSRRRHDDTPTGCAINRRERASVDAHEKTPT